MLKRTAISFLVLVFCLTQLFYAYASDIDCLVEGSCPEVKQNEHSDNTKKCRTAYVKKKNFFEILLDVFMVVTLPFSILSPQPGLQAPIIRESFKSANSLLSGDDCEQNNSVEETLSNSP